ncbi:PP2C family protein-serine/threonine phosphatase [Haliangium ochraceum]|uniref:Protein serine/threonine phosphatase n=1 Tax=Haliangium ochraceum (strain DSM 14365 / JCM 11303 / SMP-2) TaxID=502025 RepID=D0LW39_HALO1|nr:protein phosphatase 2C domain-containing protein [Haliangium ochraceum]ACY15971.1 protein serine/threonine phosphatase [Haliangium ochraceum DSM 14365]
MRARKSTQQRARTGQDDAASDAVMVETCAHSFVGCVRETNQDCFVIGDLGSRERLLVGGTVGDYGPANYRRAGAAPTDIGEVPAAVQRRANARGLLWMVCDGMGGAAGGEVASELAAEVLWEEMSDAQTTSERGVYGRLLRRAVRVANLRIWEHGRKTSALRGMGTTVSAAGLLGNALILAQVGDSRAYLCRGSHLVQLTRDQSVAAALVHNGAVSAEQARDIPHAHAVLQAVGIAKDVEVALSIARLRRGDRLLMCSDGLFGALSDAEIGSVLASYDDLSEAVAELVVCACEAGGPDNVTVVLARFDGGLLPEPDSDEEVPRFTEFDPMEEGDRALVTTSKIGRRLAAQVGIGEDAEPPVVPATGRMRVPPTPPELQNLVDRYRAASTSFDQGARLGPLPWVAAALLGLCALLLALWQAC